MASPPGLGHRPALSTRASGGGTSTESWEHAARSAVETAAATVREIRVAEVTRQDVTIENGQVTGYRVRLLRAPLHQPEIEHTPDPADTRSL